MKGRTNSLLWWAIAVNTVALGAVLGLAYGAGARSSGLRLRDFSILPPVAGFELLGAAFLIVAATIFLFVWLDNTVQKRLSEVVETAERITGGDYDAHSEVTPDDFGVLAESLNTASEKLARLSLVEAEREAVEQEISGITESLAQLGRGELGARLRSTVPSLSPLTDSFNAAAESLARRLERLRLHAADLATACTQAQTGAAASAAAFERSREDFVAAITSIDHLAAMERKMSVDADASADAARRALDFSEQGQRSVRDAADGMQHIRSSMQATAAKIKSLGDRSLEIYEIINLIHETNLLALNAVLEASRGGRGEALDVLAAELRKLADHSRTATRDIVTLLKSIQAESNDAVVIMEQATRTADHGARLTEHASKAFTGIATLLRQSADLAVTISGSARRQTKDIDDSKSMAVAQSQVAERNTVRASESLAQSEQVLRLIDGLNQALAQFRSGPAVVKPEPKPEVRAVTAAAGD
ncbi:MAG: methyl-accepting chemotaxis protein [Terriglobales bacterium]